jgi:hypothetical protein
VAAATVLGAARCRSRSTAEAAGQGGSVQLFHIKVVRPEAALGHAAARAPEQSTGWARVGGRRMRPNRAACGRMPSQVGMGTQTATGLLTHMMVAIPACWWRLVPLPSLGEEIGS